MRFQSPNVRPEESHEELFRYINLKLAALGQPFSRSTADLHALEIAGPLLRNYYQKDQLLGYRLCPADARIQAFLDAYLSDVMPQGAPRLPGNTFVLDRPGLARVMSLPPGQDKLVSPYLSSYRVAQGILHNPKSDRRTTKGVFHIAEGGFPVPADKIEVPKRAFAALLSAALSPPPEVMALPFTADQEEQVRLFVSLLCVPWYARQPALIPRKRWRRVFLRRRVWSAILILSKAFSATAGTRTFQKTMLRST